MAANRYGEKAKVIKKKQKYISKQKAEYITGRIAVNSVNKASSGLVHEMIKQETGAKPSATGGVSALYKGSLIDGTVFDESNDGSIDFPLDKVMKGWTEGLQLMNEGAILIPSYLAAI